MQNGSIAFVIQ